MGNEASYSRKIDVIHYDGRHFILFGFNHDGDVLAWAELPEPYMPEPIDMHPDAITARKYMERDLETIKALSIFDED